MERNNLTIFSTRQTLCVTRASRRRRALVYAFARAHERYIRILWGVLKVSKKRELLVSFSRELFHRFIIKCHGF
jgi:hypothetical protein